jgi:hypothetical protein
MTTWGTFVFRRRLQWLLVLESERPDAALFQDHLVLCISTGAKFARRQLHAVHAGALAV